MKKRFNSIIAATVAMTLAVSGISFATSKNAEADTVAPIKTITFDDNSDIIAVNDSNATIVDDAQRGKVISLGAGDATKDLVGAQLTNPWADATVNPEGAKEYTVDDIKYAFNYALALPYGATFRDDATATPTHPTLPTQYLVRAEGEGGVTWRSLDVAVGVALQNGAVAENTPNSINDMNTGEYKGGEFAQSVMGDTYASTRIKRAGKEVELADGSKAAVSAYKVEKEADYVRPQWDKEDGLTMSVWVKAPKGTEADTVLLSFFNDRIVEAMDAETANFNNKTGHFTVRADGSVEFMELSHYAGDPNEPSNSQKTFGRYAASRNRFTSPAIGTEEGVNVLANPGEWVCVTLVVENDYVSVYFDGIQVNYIESYVVTGETEGDTFPQDWENPENSPSWTRAEMETLVKTFNGWFGSRNTPTYVLVNSGVYAGFPSWSVSARSAYKRQPYPVAGCEGEATLINKPRITLCQWLQDSATTLYLGGSANKNLNEGTYDEATGVTTYGPENCEKQYKLVEGTMFDDIEFYGEALTASEVAEAYVNAGGTIKDTPVPSDDPTDTPVPSDDPTDTPVPSDDPTDTPVPSDNPTDTPVPSDDPTDTPVPSDDPTDTPVPSDDPTDTPELPVVDVVLAGDTDKDGSVSAADALLILKHAAKLEPLTEDVVDLADVNVDGNIDAADALDILKIAAKLEVTKLYVSINNGDAVRLPDLKANTGTPYTWNYKVANDATGISVDLVIDDSEVVNPGDEYKCICTLTAEESGVYMVSYALSNGSWSDNAEIIEEIVYIVNVK